jgi:hypothetical protein
MRLECVHQQTCVYQLALHLTSPLICSAVAAAAVVVAVAVAAVPTRPTAKWVAKHTNDGKTTYVNSVTDEEKDTLTAAEKEHLLPDLDPYNNKLIMSLKV